MLVKEQIVFGPTTFDRRNGSKRVRAMKRAGWPTKVDRILVALDFSPASMRAFDHAIELARHYGSSLIVLHVIDPMYASGTLHPMTILALKEEKRHEIKRRLDGIAERTDYDGRVTVRVEEGAAAGTIVDIAAKTRCDLIVMGVTKRAALKRLFGRSVAERVVRDADCPVLVVPDPFAAHKEQSAYA